MSQSEDCGACGGSRLRLGGWMGPTHARPFPEPCPVCSADLTPRERQGVQTAWLIDNAHREDVKEILARMATFHAKKYRLVIYLPHHETWARVGGVTYTDIAHADLVIGLDGKVIKDRFGAEGYRLSDGEIRRIKDDAIEFREVRV